MNTRPDIPDSARNVSQENDASITEIDELVSRIRSRLQAGGPAVDQDLLFDYATDDLPDAVRNEVRQKTRTWLNWHTEYWKIRAYLDLADSND